MKFIFWNICEGDDAKVGGVLKDLIEYESPEILLLAESNISDDFLINNCQMNFVHSISKTKFGLNKHLKLYAKKNVQIFPHTLYGEGEILVCSLDLPIKNDVYSVLIFGCHFVSKTTVKDSILRLKRFMKYRVFVEETENEFIKSKKKYKGSILFGDFNTNPFEIAFNDPLGILALDVNNSEYKKLKKTKYFINPSLSCLGRYSRNTSSGTKSAPGSYLHVKKDLEDSSEYFWNMIDGMIFRPNLFKEYDEGEQLEVITKIINKVGLTTELYDPKTDSILVSDHLPIKFKFNF